MCTTWKTRKVTLISSFLGVQPCLDRARKLDDVLKHKDYAGAAAYFIVNLGARKPQPVRFNASMDAQLLARIDERAQEAGMTRSGFLAEAARKELAGRR